MSRTRLRVANEAARLALEAAALNDGTLIEQEDTGAVYVVREVDGVREILPSTDPLAADRLSVRAIGGRATFSNADYTALASDLYIAQVGSLSAVRTVTLPAASSVTAGKPLTIADESGTVTEALRIVITRAGSDTINGATSIAIAAPYGRITLYSDGVDGWSVDQPVPAGRAKYSGGTYYIVPGIDLTAIAAVAMVAGNMYYGPWFVESPITIDQIACEITSAAAAGKLLRIGLYRANVDWQPTDLLIDSGNIAADSPGVKTYAVSLVLPPGRYLGAMVSDGAPTIRWFRGGNKWMGIHPDMGATPFSQLHVYAHPFGAMKNPGGAWTGFSATAGQPSNGVVCRVLTP
jgi:hypothetical protein